MAKPISKEIITERRRIIQSPEMDGLCPIAMAQNLVAGKWKIFILFLLSQQTRRFTELQRLLPGISHGILTSQLRELEKDGLIHREVYPEIPPRVEYSMSEFGFQSVPVLEAMQAWGQTYLENIRMNETPKI
jgi:DNA-binding HxlR family transcriptional regulator